MFSSKMWIGVALTSVCGFAQADVSSYEDLAEGFYGQILHHNGVTYTNVNDVSGVFPDGGTFGPGSGIEGLGNEIIVENAALFYAVFPEFGSPNNALTFGAAFVPGDNVSLGAISTVTMQLDQVASSASLEMAYLENGPWGGIVYHLDAFLGGSLVATDSFVISDLGGRDNAAIATLAVGAAAFDSMRLYATYGNEFSGPRILVDDLTITYVPAPGALAAMLGACGLASRRRR